MKTFNFLLLVGITLFCQQFSFAQATQPGEDAAPLYLRAGKLIEANAAASIWCPSSSNLEYPEWQPYPPEWQQMEKIDFSANAPARALAHQARSFDEANWPSLSFPLPTPSYLNSCRALSNDLADAALYQHFNGEDAAAIETLRDQWHLADLMLARPEKKLLYLLVSIGLRAQCIERLMVITSNVVLTKDPSDGKKLQVSVARELIRELLAQPDPQTLADDYIRADRGPSGDPMPASSSNRLARAAKRVAADRDLAAMSLACHLYKFDSGDWPKSVDQLAAYLPGLPVDPFGDGKQKLGYVLIEGGLPDGSDRPLVYSISEAKDGLFFRIDQPAYGFYVLDNNDGPHKNGGQFRDVTSWTPTTVSETPATQPLP